MIDAKNDDITTTSRRSSRLKEKRQKAIESLRQEESLIESNDEMIEINTKQPNEPEKKEKKEKKMVEEEEELFKEKVKKEKTTKKARKQKKSETVEKTKQKHSTPIRNFSSSSAISIRRIVIAPQSDKNEEEKKPKK